MSSDEDTKILCKYGAECYQKNPAHHEKFKHPKKRNRSPDNDSSKKQKVDKKIKDTNISPTTHNSPKRDVVTESTKQEKLSLSTLDERKKFIKEKFLVDMPEEFYLFWELCKEINKQNPKEAFKTVGLTLVGPFDILEDSFAPPENNDENYLLHWRFYYDPPEFQTVIKGDDTSGFHIGYYRDAPDELPSFVANNNANKDYIIHGMGENLFGAINAYLDDLNSRADPFKKMSINKLQKNLIDKAKACKIDLKKTMNGRNRKIVSKTFHTAGIVVPYDRKTQVGYRELPVNDKELKKLLDRVCLAFPDKGMEAFSVLQPVLTAATIANDECDFGTGLELGINIFCYGNKCLDNTALRFLKTSYALLDRQAFSQIAEVHLKNRKKGTPLTISTQ